MNGIQFCSNCTLWMPDTSGMKPYRQGHCPKLGKTTDAISGEWCAEYQPTKPEPTTTKLKVIL